MAHGEGNRKANKLIQSTSPYLLQHAYNPVNWFEWGPEALALAQKEDKPILVSIGYSSCHWCHVMERESFENVDIAAVMNVNLVCIKVDREERPDIDQVYMEAVQAMGLQGGWPLNVFLTPDQKPFFGGTYFQPKHWSNLIQQLSAAFRDRRGEINLSAEELTQHLGANEASRFAGEQSAFTRTDFDTAFEKLESTFDEKFGGLERAPKFVMPSIWLWLLRYHFHTGDPKSLEMTLLTLRNLAASGLYDQLGGGFARYSVDGRWFAPHFEKMLYDNAQLLSLFAEAYRIASEPRFREVIYETIDWLRREMKHRDGGFFSALDADSEGEEGKFYTWTHEELTEVLKDDAEVFCSYYQVTPGGNWEHGRNILYHIGARSNTPSSLDLKRLEKSRNILLNVREQRVRPGLDDKALTGWNAMLIAGFTDAYKSLLDPDILKEALQAAQFLETHLIEMPRCYRSFRERKSATEGFIEDYAFVIQAWIGLYECTFDETWVHKAKAMTEYVMAHFRDDTDGYFFVSSTSSERLIARKKELFDNVIPSPNSVMARNLFRLGTLLDHEPWKSDAIKMTQSFSALFGKEPGYLSNWGMAAFEVSTPYFETVITGPKAAAYRDELLKVYHPFQILMGAEKSASLPLVKDRTGNPDTMIFVCQNKTCRLPVKSVPEALQLLTSRSS